jgi:hypothetical protein
MINVLMVAMITIIMIIIVVATFPVTGDRPA